MKPVIFVLLALVATSLCLAAGAPKCGAGGAPDASKPSMCNCYSGFAPSTKAYADCDVNPQCPPIEKSDDSVGEYGANRPITSFAADRLFIYQSLPIVENRKGATIRLVYPVGIPGVVAGTPGASTCGYPGVLWNKTVSNDCVDEFRGSIPWNSNGMCGFVLDTTMSNNSTVVFRSTLVTQYNETFAGWNSQIQLRVLSKAYSIAVSFKRQLTVSNLIVNATMNAPGLTLDVIGSVMYDSMTGTTTLALRTSAPWPYKIDASSISFTDFVSTLTSGDAPTGITATIVEDTSASLSCGTTPKSLCYQQWIVTIYLGSSETCNIEGVYSYSSNLLCRDGAACGGAPSGSFSLTLLPTDFCFVSNVDATANSVYILHAYADAEHLYPAAQFGIGRIVYFDLTVVDPSATLKGITFSSIALIASGQRDTLYSTVAGTTAVTGVDLKTQEVHSIINPGTPADLSFSFQLMRLSLPNTLGKLVAGGNVAVSVEATVNLEYYGDNKKREAKIAMELSQGSATTKIQIVDEEADLTSASPVYTTSLFTILALSSYVLLF